MNEYLNKQIKVLDKGHVTLIDYMGSDEEICESARVSYGIDRKERTKAQNEDLIRYLYRHEHMSPFEMAQIKFAMKLPIFVARQLIRHRTASVNEISGRYSVMKDEYYVPEVWREPSKDNKQGTVISDNIDTSLVGVLYDNCCKTSFYNYHKLLNNGVGKEMARMELPLSTYTEWYWSCDLRNILHMLKLRLDSHAQFEIRVYAEVISKIIQSLFPMTYQAFIDYDLCANKFSKQELNCLSEVIKDKNIELDLIIEKNITNKSEQKEFKEKFKNLFKL